MADSDHSEARPQSRPRSRRQATGIQSSVPSVRPSDDAPPPPLAAPRDVDPTPPPVVITAADEAAAVPWPGDAAETAPRDLGVGGDVTPITPAERPSPTIAEPTVESQSGIGEARMHSHRLPTSRRADRKGHLGNDHSRTLIEIVNRFGVIDMRTAIALCTTIGGGVTARYYRMRVRSLEKAGVLRNVRSRDMDLGPVIGRSVLLTAGAEWQLAVAAFGADPAAAEWRDARQKWLVERVALTHTILDRVAQGWTFTLGEAWIAGLATLDRAHKLGTRARSITTAIQDGLVRFADPAAVWGMLPPDGTQHPALIIGHNATPYSTLGATLAVARRVAPIEVVCYRRSAAAIERVRRVVMKRLGGAGDSSVTVLPTASGTKWRARRHGLIEQLETGMDAGVRERLRRMIAIESAASASTPVAA